MKIDNRNKALAIYLLENKDLRLGQNLVNFLGKTFLLTADGKNVETGEFKNLTDIYYQEL